MGLRGMSWLISSSQAYLTVQCSCIDRCHHKHQYLALWRCPILPATYGVNLSVSLSRLLMGENGETCILGVLPSHTMRKKTTVFEAPLQQTNPTYKDTVFCLPKESMYGIFTYTYHQDQPNAGKYTIHGWYGFCICSPPWRSPSIGILRRKFSRFLFWK